MDDKFNVLRMQRELDPDGTLYDREENTERNPKATEVELEQVKSLLSDVDRLKDRMSVIIKELQKHRSDKTDNTGSYYLGHAIKLLHESKNNVEAYINQMGFEGKEI